MRVEFFGLPGAGKSTVSRRVAAYLVEHGHAVDEATYDIDHRHALARRALIKIGNALRFSATHPRLAFLAARAIHSTRQRTHADLKRSLSNWFLVAALLSRRGSTDRVLVLDQGLAQSVWSIGFASGRGDWLEGIEGAAIASGIIPDLVVWVRVRHTTVAHRLDERSNGDSRFERDRRDARGIDAADRRCEAVMRAMRSAGIPVMEIENETADHLAIAARAVGAAIIAGLETRRRNGGITAWPDPVIEGPPADVVHARGGA